MPAKKIEPIIEQAIEDVTPIAAPVDKSLKFDAKPKENADQAVIE